MEKLLTLSGSVVCGSYFGWQHGFWELFKNLSCFRFRFLISTKKNKNQEIFWSKSVQKVNMSTYVSYKKTVLLKPCLYYFYFQPRVEEISRYPKNEEEIRVFYYLALKNDEELNWIEFWPKYMPSPSNQRLGKYIKPGG